MKRFVLTITATFLFAVTINVTYGKVWRVDKSPENKPDFVSLQEAVNTIPAGDTLYVYGHSVSYGDIVLSKKVIIIGPGYLLNQNPITQVNKVPAMVGSFTFDAGSEFSIVGGLEIQERMIVNVSNIMIYRNRFIGSVTYFCLIITKGNQMVIQNFFDNGGGVALESMLTNVTLKNNIFQCSAAISTGEGSYCTIENNVIGGSAYIKNSIFRNNIIINGEMTANDNTLAKNNVFYNSPFNPLENKTNIDMTTVFVGGTSPDGYYQLKDNSPAKGYGWNGVDCGAFGGADAYVLSGIPSIPTIYEADIPITGSNKDGLPVKIKAKTNK